MNIAFVFAGQGAQYSGMGKEIYHCSAKAKEIFECAKEIRSDILDVCFSGSTDDLKQTINTQPAVYLTDLACAAALEEAGIRPTCVAGFSAGEIPALAFAGAFSYTDGFKIMLERAQLMDSCAQKNPGIMAAVLKLSECDVLNLCERHGVFAVNFNCPGQIVVAGAVDKMEDFIADVTAMKGRAMKLAVSGAFHSVYMNEASEGFANVLANYSLKAPHMPVYANVTAKPYEGSFDLLSLQIRSSVLWQQTVENMAKQGIDTFIEVGAGKTLSGLIAKTVDATVLNVADKSSLEATLAVLKK